MSYGRRLTDAVVAACVATSKEYSIRDAGMKGMSLRVQPSGAKTWVLRGHLPDRTRRATLGDARLLTVDQARARAHVLLSRGEAPPPEPVQVSPRFREFAKLHRARRKDQWKKTTLKSYDSYMKATLLPAFRRKRLSEIGKVDVARWFHKYSRRAPGGANRALDVLKELFNRAKEWEAVPVTYTNPCLRIKRNRRPPRGRLLNHDALTKLGAALDRYAETHPDVVDAIRLILLTGCRSGEIHRLRWAEVLPDRLELQSAKTGPRTVRIGTPALKLLERRRQSASASATYVFAHHRNSKRPLMEISETWKRIREAAGLPNDIRLHDLRHYLRLTCGHEWRDDAGDRSAARPPAGGEYSAVRPSERCLPLEGGGEGGAADSGVDGGAALLSRCTGSLGLENFRRQQYGMTYSNSSRSHDGFRRVELIDPEDGTADTVRDLVKPAPFAGQR